MRKQIVASVFGEITQARGFRQFRLRGAGKVKTEWALVAIARNLTELVSLA